ncbi:hypothetical protein [Agrococcus carbonis]|uniref:Uncharacterized protein n=1 Tax=Agrococcus carbonis TaxID=684552 RepID=A0A1H1NBZ7_9MICO|nr:hypothetical protein [Agrococcus carbonis]SDR95889.1 hypothetical protein SAMN04489719_1216 [Agrococcus carbonis]
MSAARPGPPSTAWLVVGLVALALLLTGALLPRWISAVLLAVAVVMYLRSGDRRAGDADEP